MSFEGYYQCLCENGHLTETDVTVADPSEPCRCLARIVWWVIVDQTNGEEDGRVDLDPYQVTPECWDTCSLGHKHMVEPAVYRIPPTVGYRR